MLRYVVQGKNKVPFTCVRWRQTNDCFRTSYVIVTTNSDGDIQHWHMTTGKCMSTIKDTAPGDPQLNNLDFNMDCSKFAVVGANPVVQVYDAERRERDLVMNGEGGIIPGHSNRLYSVKFVNDIDHPN
jgi:COMPASS component SWD3